MRVVDRSKEAARKHEWYLKNKARLVAKAAAWEKANLDKVRAKKRNRYQSDEEYRAKVNARTSAWQRHKWQTDEDYRQRRLAYTREWYARKKAA